MKQAQQSFAISKQQLSALYDGELAAPEVPLLLDAVAADATLRTTWERYHLIGRAIRGDTSELVWHEVAERVQTALAPAPLPVPRQQTMRRRASAWIGLALAAGVSGVVVINLLPTLESSRATARNLPVVPVLTERWQLAQPTLAHKLDRLLVTHQETAPAPTTKGMLRYAAFVSHDEHR